MIRVSLPSIAGMVRRFAIGRRIHVWATAGVVCATVACAARGQSLLSGTVTGPSADQRTIEQRFLELERAADEMPAPAGSATGSLADTEALGPRSIRLARAFQSPSSFADQPEDIRGDAPALQTEDEIATSGRFGEGFKWTTSDGEFDLVFHNETQLDTRAYGQGQSDPVNQFGFYISRMRLYFNGHLTEPIEYSVSVNKGLGDLDLLDAYFNFNFDDRLQFRAGRFRVPFTYDWYALSNQFLPTPERSVFAINYGYNRNWALMLHGEVAEESAEYAVAAVLGPRNQYFDYNADKDVLAYLNYRPFQNVEGLAALKNLNLGGSAAYGVQDQRPRPTEFRTSLNATESEGAVEAAPSFLVLDPLVRERGPRSMGELHCAYFYQSLTVMGAYDWGYNSYAAIAEPDHPVPVNGYHVQSSYFLTGEELTRRTFVEPLAPLGTHSGRRGWGAIEIQARYDDFFVGDAIFTDGFADPVGSTNHVRTVDAGLNWYLNQYMKIYFDWQHAMFAHPVALRPGAFRDVSDLFWTRIQVYF